MPPFVATEEDEEEEEEGERTGLAEAINALVDANPELDLTWAESVRQILESTKLPPPSPRHKRQWGQPQHQDKVLAGLQGELVVLKTALNVSSSHRRQALNRMLDLKGNIRVFCRLRPFLSHEKNARPGPFTTPGTDLIKLPRKDFQFDRVFLPSSVQDEVFSEVEPIIRSALDGHNVCIFAYGQTGTGKTFTMEGTREKPGVVPRTLQMLFDEAFFDATNTYNFSLSMLEVYKGSLRDLLVRKPTRPTDPASPCLQIKQMATNGYIDVENLTELPIMDANEAGKLYLRGSRSRSTAWTHANESSSRSHCLLRITITCTSIHKNRTYVTTSKLWLVDLGGSERLLKTNATGITLEEGKAINLSLSALGDVISALQRKEPHIPYRNSKLTQLLRDSLGKDHTQIVVVSFGDVHLMAGGICRRDELQDFWDKSKTLMLVHVSPKEDDLGETICSLTFATRARGTHLGRELSQSAKREKAAAMAELYRLTNIYEDECQGLRKSIKTIEALMEERKASLPEHMMHADDGLNASVPQPATPLQEPRGPHSRTSPTTFVNGVPRFMSPTASSRGKKRSDPLASSTKTPSPTDNRPVKTNHQARPPKKASTNPRVEPQPGRGAPWPTMIKEVINEVLPRGDVVIVEEDTSGQPAEGEEGSAIMRAKVHKVEVQQQEAVERTITVTSTKGGTCRGRRKVTVDVSMTVAKRFVF